MSKLVAALWSGYDAASTRASLETLFAMRGDEAFRRREVAFLADMHPRIDRLWMGTFWDAPCDRAGHIAAQRTVFMSLNGLALERILVPGMPDPAPDLARLAGHVLALLEARPSEAPGVTMQSPDVIVIGAGHNGMAAAALLARRGHRVLVLERNRYVGGMAGSREILSGCRNDVGASLLFPLAKGLAEERELERHGVELLPLPIMSVSTAAPGDPLLVFFTRIRCGWRGTSSAPSARRRSSASEARRVHPLSGEGDRALCEGQPAARSRAAPRRGPENAKARERLASRLPRQRDRPDRPLLPGQGAPSRSAQLSFAAVQSTFKGPFTPGSAFCLIYALSPNDAGGLMKRVRGGMGTLYEALQRSIEAKGGEVRLGAPVRRILVENGRAVGVALRGGEEIRAGVVVSNLDKQSTLLRLAGEERVPAERRGERSARSTTAAPSCTCSSSSADCRATARPTSISTPTRRRAAASVTSRRRRSCSGASRPASAASCRRIRPRRSRSRR